MSLDFSASTKVQRAFSGDVRLTTLEQGLPSMEGIGESPNCGCLRDDADGVYFRSLMTGLFCIFGLFGIFSSGSWILRCFSIAETLYSNYEANASSHPLYSFFYSTVSSTTPYVFRHERTHCIELPLERPNLARRVSSSS